jgi:N-sulfoglucosamine sulfohydrolase
MLRAVLVLLALAAAAVADARNVLLIIADDQGRDLAAYGNPVLRTPNLDRLAARGTLFTNAFATVSSCSPSRSVIYTGLY